LFKHLPHLIILNVIRVPVSVAINPNLQGATGWLFQVNGATVQTRVGLHVPL
jgi:hypothetical protein